MNIETIETAELVKELTRRGIYFAGNCTLTAWNNGPKGMTFGFKADQKEGEDVILHTHPFEGCFVGKDGDRFFVVAHAIANKTEPKLNPRPKQGPYCFRAVMLSRSRGYQEFIQVETEEEASTYIKQYCHVNSRKDIDGNPEAMAALDTLENDYHEKQRGRI